MNLNEKVTVLVDHEHPLKSPNTQAVSAALSCGGEFPDSPYLDTIEHGADGKPRRTVVWLLKEKEITFEAFSGETITQSEFIRRWKDRQWVLENPTHPMAYMICHLQTLANLRDHIHEATPTIKVVKGGRAAFFPANATPAEQSKWTGKL